MLLFTILILALLGSFLCAGMETGLFALNRWRVARWRKAGSRAAHLLQGYLQDHESFLWTILVGNTLCALAAISIVVIQLRILLGTDLAVFIPAFIVCLFLFYTFFDLFPKLVFSAFPNRLCMLGAVPFQGVRIAVWPLVRVIDWLSTRILRLTGGKRFTGKVFHSRQELQRVMVEAQNFTTEERQMIQRVLDLQTRKVGDILQPMQKLPEILSGMTVAEMLRMPGAGGHNFLPVWFDHQQKRTVLGMIDVKRAVHEHGPESSVRVGALLKPALYLDRALSVEQALSKLRKGGARAAVVLGDDQREAGMVTVNDIVGAVVGEVRL